MFLFIKKKIFPTVKNPTAKCPYVEVSSRRSVLTAKSPAAKCPTGKSLTAKSSDTNDELEGSYMVSSLLRCPSQASNC